MQHDSAVPDRRLCSTARCDLIIETGPPRVQVRRTDLFSLAIHTPTAHSHPFRTLKTPRPPRDRWHPAGTPFSCPVAVRPIAGTAALFRASYTTADTHPLLRPAQKRCRRRNNQVGRIG